MQKTINDDYLLVIIIRKYCINKGFCFLLGFDYFEEGVSICLWCHLLTIVVGTTFVTLTDSAKQARLVVFIGQSSIQ